jgi:hypothetical protein
MNYSLTEAKQKAQEANSGKSLFIETAMSKWSDVKMGDFRLGHDLLKLSEKSLLRANVAAVALENQERHFKKLTETQLSTSFGTALRPEHLLKAVYIGSAQSKLADMFTVIPLASTDDVFMYVYMNRGSTLRGGVAGTRPFESQAPEYEGEEYPDTAMTGALNGSNKTFTISLAPTPIVPLHVYVKINGAIVGRDNGSGTIINSERSTAIDTTTTNTVDYNTGSVVINLASAPISTDEVTIRWNSSLEGKTNFDAYAGDYTIEIRKERFNARPYPLGFNYSMMTQIMLDTDNIGNAHELMTTKVAEGLAKSMDERGIRFIASIARGNSIRTFDTAFAQAGAVDRNRWAQNLSNAIANVSAEMTNDQQRGAVNKIVCGPLAAAYLGNHDKFVSDDSEIGYAGARKIGKLSNLEVFQIPSTAANVLGNDELLLTFSNPLAPEDCPAIFGNLTTLSAELTFPQLNTQGTLASVYDQRLINPGFARILKLKNLNYNI